MRKEIHIGDCFKVMASIPDKTVDFVLSDIPYNEVNGKIEGGFQRVNRGDADRADDGAEFDARKYIQECIRICKGNIVIFCGYKQAGILREEMQKAKCQMIRMLVWDKNNCSPMNGQYFFLNSNEWAVACRQKGAYFSGKCLHATMHGPSHPLKWHPTAKPIWLLKNLIEWCCPEGGIVFDGCAGSFTTAVAANELERGYICAEYNTEYCKNAIAHWGERLGGAEIHDRRED